MIHGLPMRKIKHQKINYVCPVTIKDIYKKYLAVLNPVYGAGETAAVTNIIFEYYAGLTGAAMVVKGIEPASKKLSANLDAALEKLLHHVPVQYITGEAHFCGLIFKVNAHVLIPRPETEELVHEVMQFLQIAGKKTVIDIGTGSGCIPITVKKNIPAADLVAVDISPDALHIARTNAGIHSTEIDLRIIDFLDDEATGSLPGFDIIISNPPYIPEREAQLLDKNVTGHEPHLALFVPDNAPLIFYKKIKHFAVKHLNPRGRIFLEVHENFAGQVAELFEEKDYSVLIKKDISGKERMIIIDRCP